MSLQIDRLAVVMPKVTWFDQTRWILVLTKLSHDMDTVFTEGGTGERGHQKCVSKDRRQRERQTEFSEVGPRGKGRDLA